MPARLMDKLAIGASLDVGCWTLEFHFSDRRSFYPQTRRLNRARDLFAGEESVYAARCFFTFRHRVDYFLAAVGAIASSEDVRQIGLPRLRIVNYHTTRVELQRREEFL